MPDLDTSLNIGDFIRVQIHKIVGPTRTVSVVSGTIVKEEHHAWATWSQYQLDNGIWFSPDSDKILEHRPHAT